MTRHLDGRLPIRTKARKPTVGFCGMAPPGLPRLPQLGRAARGEISIRARALRVLRCTRGVRTNYTIRKGFVGGAVEGGKTDAKRLWQVRREYVANTVGSDYVLCARGAGNYSYRLYETLSCGRIPVFIDTDCVLPYDFAIDWKRYTVWVDESEIEEIGTRVLDFHASLSDREFLELQHECRRLWEEYIRPEGFFKNFHRHFEATSAAQVQ